MVVVEKMVGAISNTFYECNDSSLLNFKYFFNFSLGFP